MKYKLLFFNAMPFNRNLHYDWKGYFVGFREKDGVLLMIFSKDSYEIISSIKLHYNVSAYFEKHIYFYHTEDKNIKRLDIESLNISDFDGYLFPQINWGSSDCYHNIESKKYEVYSKNHQKLFEFKYEYPIVTKLIYSGILIFQNSEKENNWIKCLDPNGGKEKWKVDFPWQFVRLETYKNLIVLEYQAYDNIRTDKGYEGEIDWYNPSKYTIVLNGDTGEEVWKYPNGYHHIDHENEVVLLGNVNSRLPSGKIESLSVVELSIKNGKILTEVEVRPAIERVPNFCFVDDTGIYYTSHDGSFGKINKANGSILWEFHLIDNKGEKRKLSDWLLLGNGNLVLQAMPNHPNGDILCIFNPWDNMEYSRVKEGKRIGE